MRVISSMRQRWVGRGNEFYDTPDLGPSRLVWRTGQIAGFFDDAVPHPTPRPRNQQGLEGNLRSRIRAAERAKKTADAIDLRPPR